MIFLQRPDTSKYVSCVLRKKFIDFLLWVSTNLSIDTNIPFQNPSIGYRSYYKIYKIKCLISRFFEDDGRTNEENIIAINLSKMQT